MARRHGRGELGRRLKVSEHCYAGAVIGGCYGRVSQEHPVSEGLRKGKTLIVLGHHLPLGTQKWNRLFSEEVTARGASAPVLCGAHNQALSSADAEAKKLSTGLYERMAQQASAASALLPPIQLSLDGNLIARWCCKVYCGSMAMPEKTAHPDFVRYAFGQPTDRRLYFLFPVRGSTVARLARTGIVSIRAFQAERHEAFYVVVDGLELIGTTLMDGPEMDEIYGDVGLPTGTEIRDRCPVLDMPGLRISLDWKNDPDRALVLDPKGMLVSSRDL
jgi:hypothetical protein